MSMSHQDKLLKQSSGENQCPEVAVDESGADSVIVRPSIRLERRDIMTTKDEGECCASREQHEWR